MSMRNIEDLLYANYCGNRQAVSKFIKLEIIGEKYELATKFLRICNNPNNIEWIDGKRYVNSEELVKIANEIKQEMECEEND